MCPYQLVSASEMTSPAALTREQVREVDRIAIQELAIPGIVLMENAGLNATAALLDHVKHTRALDATQVRAAVLCGGGNNGGDGYVIARQLHNRGAAVAIYALKDPAELTGDAAVNHQICARMGLPISVLAESDEVEAAASAWREANVLVDALLGTGFHGEVREPTATAIQAVNRIRAAARQKDATPGGAGSGGSASGGGPLVLAVDVPSGLDCDRGAPTNATIEADLTVTFVAAKTLLLTDAARRCAGMLAVADIGAPPGLVDRVRQQI